MPKAQSGKSKRPRSEKAKLIAARSRMKAAQRHLANARAQLAQYQRNLELVAAGTLTAWAQACKDRADRRAATCGTCRLLFVEDACPRCGGTRNLKDVWAKAHA